MMLKNLFLVLLLAAASAAFTTRLPKVEKYYAGLPVPKHLRGFDLDGDGSLTSVELQLGGILFLFQAADKNWDHYITKEEFTNVERQRAVPLPIYKTEHFDQYDSNGDGKLRFYEYAEYWCKEIRDASPWKIRKAVSAMDKELCLKYKKYIH